MTRMKLWALLAALCALLMVAAGCGDDDDDSGSSAGSGATAASDEAPEETAKVALLMNSPINSPGFGSSFKPAADELESQLGDDFTLADNVQPAEYDSTATQVAQRGNELVIFNSAVFTETAMRVAAQFPDTQFVLINGGVNKAPNLSSYAINWEQAGFLTGAAAAYTTKSNEIGSISGTLGGTKLPPIVMLNDGFKQAVTELNPDANVTITYTQSFSDPASSAAAAQAQFGKGIDVVWADTDAGDSGIFKTAEREDKLVIGYGSDQSSLAPDNTVTSTLVNYSDIILEAFSQFQEDSLKPVVNTLDIDSGAFELAPIENLDEDAVAKIEDAVAKIESGELGPK
jgi:basic membrane protein A and related proteins